MTRESKRQIARIWTLIGVGMIVVTCCTYGPSEGGGSTVSVALLLIGLFWLGLPIMLYVAHNVGHAFGQELKVAGARVPSPAEIAAQLQAEWGRPATVQEVAAVHQMLQGRKNQALISTGLGIGALYLINRTDRWD